MGSTGGQDHHPIINPIVNRTGAERRLARALRAQKWNFEQNQRIEGYEVDFWFPEYHLVVEVDGYTHLSAVQTERDNLKDRKLIDAGYVVIRLPNQAIWNDLQGSIEMLRTLISRMKTVVSQASINDQWKTVLRQVQSELLHSGAAKAHAISSSDVEAFFLSLENNGR